MLRARRISGLEELNLVLAGGVSGGTDLRNQNFYIHGLMLEVDEKEITFNSGGTQGALTWPQVLEQIREGLSEDDYDIRLRKGGQISIRSRSNSAVVVAGDGTANAVFGFNEDEDTVGTVYGVDTVPRLVSVTPVTTGEDALILITEESDPPPPSEPPEA